ncbi:MAG: hypothetical protein COA85_08205 [Robiginitomaculum sp.]|nr:MAG: hypothetical protein COA85_08205 [Robiginitomaculum sp.]
MTNLPPVFNKNRLIRFAALIINGLLQAGCAIGVSLSLRQLFNDNALSSETLLSGVGVPVLLITVFSLVLGLLKWRERVDIETLGQDYVVDTRMRIFKHISSMSVRAMDKTRKGLILLRFVNDLTALRNWICLGLARSIISGIVIIVALTALTIMNPLIGGMLMLLLTIGAVILLALGKIIDHTIREARRRRGNIAGNISEKLEQMVLVQAFAQRRTERRKIKRQSFALRNATIERASASGVIRAVVRVLAGLSLAISGGIGAMAVRSGSATMGEVIAAIGMVTLITPSMFTFGRVYEYWKSAVVAKEKIVSLLMRGPVVSASTNTKPLGKVKGNLVFDRISITGGLTRFSAQAKAGDTIGLYGANGSGKSTLLFLALRLLDPDKGKVLLDGRNLCTIRSGELRRAISIASSSMPLLRGTISSNIAYGSSKSTDEDVIQAAEMCGMDITSSASLFYGQRQVHEGGVNLSAGERMRVNLARALVCKPKILLLDEPEEHLDSTGLAILKKIIKQFSGTIILATHDLNLLEQADDIWYLSDA